MKVSDAILGLMMIGLAAAVFLVSADFPRPPGSTFGAGLFPRILASGFAICGALLVLKELRASQREPLVERPDWAQDGPSFLRFILVPGGILFYILVSDDLGMIVTTAVILITLFVILDVRWRVALPVAIIAPTVIFWVFSRFLLVPLPQGVLAGLPLP